jgi:2-succinyl-5-enolpyruvyl-6-hydroxy-3-cyclohexene-1-carboxylate synthase
VIRDFVLDAQATEPTIGQVHLHLTAKQPLRADGEDIAHDQHADHEYWINRRAAKLRVVARQLRIDPRKVQYTRDLADTVIVGNDLIEAE